MQSKKRTRNTQSDKTTTGVGTEPKTDFRDKRGKIKGTGEAGTLGICLAFQCVPDFKGGSLTGRTQTNAVSGAIIELSSIQSWLFVTTPYTSS